MRTSFPTVKIREKVVTLPASEFIRLQREAEAYRAFTAKVFELPLRDSVERVVEDFRATDLYTEGFLRDLGTGLQKSSYTKRWKSKR